jgi:hypothetical protein
MIGMIWEGEFVIVEGVSQKGKNRIQEHGAVWLVAKAMDSGRVMLESTDGKNAKRWVDDGNDPDFELMRIVDPDTLENL